MIKMNILAIGNPRLSVCKNDNNKGGL